GLRALVGVADDADPAAGRRRVRRGLDIGDRHEADARVLHVAGQDLADLLAQELVDPISACRHATPSQSSSMPGGAAKAGPRTEASVLERYASDAAGPNARRVVRGGDLCDRRSTDRLGREAFEDIAFDDVRGRGEADAALERRLDLAHVVLEPAQRVDLGRRAHLA